MEELETKTEAEPNFTEEHEELSREDSKSPVQEVEEEQFTRVELADGLEQLNEALKREDIKEIRSCYTNLTKSFPTAVIKKRILIWT